MKHPLNAFRLPTLIAIFLAVIHWSGARVISLSAMQFTDTKTLDPARNYYYTVNTPRWKSMQRRYNRRIFDLSPNAVGVTAACQVPRGLLKAWRLVIDGMSGYNPGNAVSCIMGD